MNDKRARFLRLTTILLLLAAAPSIQAQTFSVLYNFGAANGAPLNPGWAQGRYGNLYSTTSNGGTYGFGTVFRMTPAGKLTVLPRIQFVGSLTSQPLRPISAAARDRQLSPYFGIFYP